MSLFCRCSRPPYKVLPRPYQKCVLVGNWFEERVLEEDIVQDYLYKREHGELTWQKLNRLNELCLRPSPITRTSDPYVRYGNRIMLINHEHGNCFDRIKTLCLYVPDDILYVKEYTDAIINLPPKELSASTAVLSPTVISTFVIRGRHGAQDGTLVKFGEPLFLYSSNEKLLMMSMKRSPFFKKPLFSPNNWTALVAECSWNCAFRAVPYDPRERMELEGEPVKSNMRIIINHVESNENLCVDEDYEIRTPFGIDKEVTCRTKRDSARLELPANHWVLFMDAPGKEKYPIKIPLEDIEPQKEVCDQLHATT